MIKQLEKIKELYEHFKNMPNPTEYDKGFMHQLGLAYMNLRWK